MYGVTWVRTAVSGPSGEPSRESGLTEQRRAGTPRTVASTVVVVPSPTDGWMPSPPPYGPLACWVRVRRRPVRRTDPFANGKRRAEGDPLPKPYPHQVVPAGTSCIRVSIAGQTCGEARSLGATALLSRERLESPKCDHRLSQLWRGSWTPDGTSAR